MTPQTAQAAVATEALSTLDAAQWMLIGLGLFFAALAVCALAYHIVDAIQNPTAPMRRDRALGAVTLHGAVARAADGTPYYFPKPTQQIEAPNEATGGQCFAGVHSPRCDVHDGGYCTCRERA